MNIPMFLHNFFIVWSFISTSYIVFSESDCLYNKCEFKMLPNRSSHHVPCLGAGERKLIRDVVCDNGVIYHICCNWPLRPDIQESRHKWFQKVTWTGEKVSLPCTYLVLCEQACKDGLQGSTRSNYPQLLIGEMDSDRRYVDAYNNGENAACYRQSDPDYNDKSCEKVCHEKYPNCQKQLDSSPFVKAYYEFSRNFHRLEMWAFDIWWAINDDVDWLIKNGTSTLEAVKKSVDKIMLKMDNMQKSFKKLIGTLQRRRRRQEEDVNVDALWNEFKVTFNETDPQLVQMTQNMKWDEFHNVFIILSDIMQDNRTFRDNSAVKMGVNCFVITFFLLFPLNT